MPVHERVLVPEPPVMLGGFTEHVSPVVGEIPVVRATVPAKPFTAITVMVELPATPGVVLTMFGLANIWKSTTWTNIVPVVWASEPLVPVTVTV